MKTITAADLRSNSTVALITVAIENKTLRVEGKRPKPMAAIMMSEQRFAAVREALVGAGVPEAEVDLLLGDELPPGM